MWPPTVDELKSDLRSASTVVIGAGDTAQLQTVLDAAVAFVERTHAGRFNFDGESGSDLPDVPDDVRLGTLRLAGRWHVRRRSPDALVQMAELGASRVPAFDPDIERMLRIGKYAPAVFA